ALALHLLGPGRGVVDAAPLELLDPWDVEPPVLGSGGDHDGAGSRRLAVRELDLVPARLALQAHRRSRHRQLRPELERLDARPLGELAARDPRGETEVV